MAPLEFRHYHPATSARSARIPKEKWEPYDPLIREWHEMGLTAAEQLDRLKNLSNGDLSPS